MYTVFSGALTGCKRNRFRANHPGSAAYRGILDAIRMAHQNSFHWAKSNKPLDLTSGVEAGNFTEGKVLLTRN